MTIHKAKAKFEIDLSGALKRFTNKRAQKESEQKPNEIQQKDDKKG